MMSLILEPEMIISSRQVREMALGGVSLLGQRRRETLSHQGGDSRLLL
jgi:hypothetical protein